MAKKPDISIQALRSKMGTYNEESLIRAIQKGNKVSRIKEIIQKHPEFLASAKDEEGNNVLAIAIKHAQNTETLQALLDGFNEPQAIKKALMQPNNAGKMVLMHYIKSSQAELAAGFDGHLKPNLSDMLKVISKKTNFTMEDWIDIFKVKKDYSDNMLHTWAIEGDAQSIGVVLKLLASHPPNDPMLIKFLNTPNDNNNKTILELAVEYNQVEVVKTLIGPHSILRVDQQKEIFMLGLQSIAFKMGDSQARQEIIGILQQANRKLNPPAPQVNPVLAQQSEEPKSFSLWQMFVQAFFILFKIKSESANISLEEIQASVDNTGVEPSKFALDPSKAKVDPFNMTATFEVIDTKPAQQVTPAYETLVDKQKQATLRQDMVAPSNDVRAPKNRR